MRVVPELGGDEEFVAFYDGGDDLLERRADFILVLVDEGGVDVPVSVTDSVLDLTYRREIRNQDLRRISYQDTGYVRRSRLPWAWRARCRGRSERRVHRWRA